MQYGGNADLCSLSCLFKMQATEYSGDHLAPAAKIEWSLLRIRSHLEGRVPSRLFELLDLPVRVYQLCVQLSYFN
jgi:hypothetical protein